MKNWISLFWMLCAFAALASAQRMRDDRRDEIESLRTAYITKELALTPEESQRFWPIYNEYQEKDDELDRRRVGSGKDINTMTDKEVEELLEQQLQRQEARIALQREYIQKLKKAIPVRKIALLKRAEHDFKRELLRQMRDHRRGGGGGGGR